MQRTHIHILLIEDMPEDARLIEELLRDQPERPYRFQRAESLAAAFDLLQEAQQVDIILLDLNLPDSHGFATFQRLHETFPAYPIIIMTGMSDTSLGLRAVKLGAQDYIDKNYLNGQVLTNSIRYSIERNQMLQRLEHAQRLAKVGNWDLDLTSNELYCSKQLAEILEVTRNEDFQHFSHYLARVHPEDQANVAQAVLAACENHASLYEDHRILLPNGRVKYLEIKARVQKDLEGNFHLLGTTQDITDRIDVEQLRREKELALREAKLRQEFLAKTSHEIRTPLNPILVLTSILLKTQLTDEQRDHLMAIKSAGDTLLAVVNDILDLSKIEAGSIHFYRHHLNIAQVFASVKDMMLANASSKGLDLIMESSPDLPGQVVGDNVRLIQILLNLIGNAIKFTRKGHIKVTATLVHTEEQAVRVRFTVADTGIGIPRNKFTVIFDSFKQIDSDENRRYGGTGLGLTIVRQLVKLQGGSITVDSEEGQGAAFTFVLPFEIALNPEDAPPTDVNIDKEALRGLKVLLVEDNPLNQMVTRRLLEDWNIQLDIANHGKEGVEMLENLEVDLVLMDVQMPEMDGYEATRHIRTRMAEPKKNLPIIALTANAFVGSDDECFKAGMDDYVSKPIEMRVLYSKLLKHAPAHILEPAKPANNGLALETTPKPPSEVSNGRAPKPDSVPDGPPHSPQPQEPQISTKEQPMEYSRYTDLSYLKEISTGDPIIIKKTVDKFLETTPPILDQMDTHLQEEEHYELGRCAHKLKSSLAFMGIEELKSDILQVERITKAKDEVDKLPPLVSHIREVIEASYQELRGELKRL